MRHQSRSGHSRFSHGKRRLIPDTSETAIAKDQRLARGASLIRRGRVSNSQMAHRLALVIAIAIIAFCCVFGEMRAVSGVLAIVDLGRAGRLSGCAGA
jgi:hypothetical protein